MAIRGVSNKELTEIVRECVNSADPEQLLKLDCPHDEYEPEIADIVRSFRIDITEYEIWVLVCNVLWWHFGDHAEPALYWNGHKELTRDIFEKVRTPNAR